MGCFDSKVEPDVDRASVRGCTDVFWLIIYIIFWGFMVLIAAFSFVYGSPVRLINGYDSFGNTCGKSDNQIRGNLELSGLNTEDRPYLFFMDLKHLRKALKVCVKKCPDKKMEKIDDLKRFYDETGSNLCKYNHNFTETQIGLSGSLGPCPVLPVHESIPVLNRCVPKYIKDVGEQLLSNVYGLLNSWDFFEQVLSDLYRTWKEILGLTFVALGISLFTVAIMHCLASFVSYIVMILVSVALIFLTGFFWFVYFDIKYNLDKIPKSTLLLESVRNETAFFWGAIIATIFTIIILILVFFMRKNVDFLANLFKETSKCLASIPGLFLQPIATFVFLLAFFIFWIFVVIYSPASLFLVFLPMIIFSGRKFLQLCLATAYYPGTKGVTPLDDLETTNFTSVTPTTEAVTDLKPLKNISIFNLKKFTVVEYVDPIWVKYMWWFYFIGLIWSSEFIMACQQMVIAGSVAHWYYRHQYKTNDHVMYSILKLIKYHLGSMALGSLLITIFKIPRLILTYLYARLEASSKNDNESAKCAKCSLKCCICCFFCLEKFIRYINHNAYTVIAIDGVNFCAAAKTAFEVLTAHSLQVATINSVGDFILFLGKCFVTAATGSIALFIFRQNENLKFYFAPTFMVCVFSFFIAHCLLSLYEMVLDTLYLCMCQNNEPEARENIQLENMIPPNANNGQMETNGQLTSEE